MVSVRSKKVQKLTYTQRVLSALSHIQKDSRKHAIHLATIRAQVRKHADGRKDKLGPQWAHFVTKAVHKLEDEGILQRVDGGPTGQVSFTPGGRKSISSVRRTIPHTESTEDVLWQYVTRQPPIVTDAATPATTTSQLPSTPHGAATQPQRDYTTPTRKRGRPSGSPLKRVTRPRFSTISTHVYLPEDDDMDSNTDGQTSTPMATISKGGRKSVRLSTYGAHSQRYDEDMADEDDAEAATATTKPKKAISKMSKPELKAELLRMRRVSLGLRKENEQLSVRLRGTDVESEEDGMDIFPGSEAADPFERPLSPLTDIDDGSPPPSPPPMIQDEGRIPTRPSTPTQQASVPTIHLPSPSQTSLASSLSPENQQAPITPNRNANHGSLPSEGLTRTQSGSLISHISRRPTPAPSNPSSPTYPTLPLAPSDAVERSHSGGAGTSSAQETEKLKSTIAALQAQRDRVSATNMRLEEQLLTLHTVYPERMGELHAELSEYRKQLRLMEADKDEQLAAMESQLSSKTLEVDTLKHDLEITRADLSVANAALVEENATLQGEKTLLERNVEEHVSTKTALLQEVETLKGANDQLVETADRSKVVNQDLEARIGVLKEQAVQDATKISQLVEEKAQVQARLDEVTSKHQKLEEASTELQKTVSQLESERVEARGRIEALSLELVETQAQLLVVQGNLAERVEEIGRLQEETDRQTNALVGKTEELRATHVELTTNAVTLEANSSEIARLRSDLDDAQHQLEISAERIIQNDAQIADLEHQWHETNGRLEAAQEEVEVLRERTSGADNEIHQLNVLFGDTHSSLTSAQQELASVKDELANALVDQSTIREEVMRLHTELPVVRQERDDLQTIVRSQAVDLETALGELEDERKKLKVLVDDHAELRSLKEGDEATIRALNQRTTKLKQLVEDLKKGQAEVWGKFVGALDDLQPGQDQASSFNIDLHSQAANGLSTLTGSSLPNVPTNFPQSVPLQ